MKYFEDIPDIFYFPGSDADTPWLGCHHMPPKFNQSKNQERFRILEDKLYVNLLS